MYCCPKCKEPLIEEEKRYLCKNRHSYDIAKQGYVSLVLGHKSMHGDDVGMIQARTRFLEKGYYAFLKDALCDMLVENHVAKVVDAGCGEGYYTNAFSRLSNILQIYGIDLSKAGIKHACKAKGKAKYAVASIAQLPFADASMDAVISIFTPVYPDEFARVLKDTGIFIKVGPAAKHLWELKELLYDQVYENVSSPLKSEQFLLKEQKIVTQSIKIDNNPDILSLFQMTPYYYRTSKEAKEKLLQKQEMDLTLSFMIEVYQKIAQG